MLTAKAASGNLFMSDARETANCNSHALLMFLKRIPDAVKKKKKDIKLFSCSTQLSMKSILFANVKMPTIMKFISSINDRLNW